MHSSVDFFLLANIFHVSLIFYLVPLVENNLAHDLSDEMCSRSTSIREKHTGGKPAMDASLMNTPRKRKKKKKGAAISTAEFPISHHSSGVHPIAGLTEDPIPQGRQDILRGGAPQHVNTPAPPLNTEQQLFPVKRKKTHPKLCSDTDCSTNEREMAAIAEEHSGGGVRKRRKRSHQRVSRHRPSFPWSLSSQRYLQGRHQHKREFSLIYSPWIRNYILVLG